jgi:hypothetical protein
MARVEYEKIEEPLKIKLELNPEEAMLIATLICNTGSTCVEVQRMINNIGMALDAGSTEGFSFNHCHDLMAERTAEISKTLYESPAYRDGVKAFTRYSNA